MEIIVDLFHWSLRYHFHTLHWHQNFTLNNMPWSRKKGESSYVSSLVLIHMKSYKCKKIIQRNIKPTRILILWIIVSVFWFFTLVFHGLRLFGSSILFREFCVVFWVVILYLFSSILEPYKLQINVEPLTVNKGVIRLNQNGLKLMPTF